MIASIGGTGFGDIALVPAPGLKHPKGIRDITEWYVSLAIRRGVRRSRFHPPVRDRLGAAEAVLHAMVGNAIDIIYLCGTDFGTQASRFCSLETFDRLWAPHYPAHQRMDPCQHDLEDDEAHLRRSGVLVVALCDVGFDIFNPIQCSAAGMDPRGLKRTYGDRLVFYGGGVNPQQTFPSGRRPRCGPRCWSAVKSLPGGAATSSTQFTASRPTRRSRTSWPCWMR